MVSIYQGLATTREIAHQLGARVRLHRLQQLLTQGELAARAGVSPSAVKTLESTGKSSMDTLIRVAASLGLQRDFAQLFVHQPALSISDLEHLEKVQTRQRAPRRKRA